MEPNRFEIEISSVFAFHKELDTGKPPDPHYLQGYDPQVYPNRITRDEGDALIAHLCLRLSKATPEVIQKYSLELQMWWRDHQKADAKRELEESLEQREEDIRQTALQKLTEAERNVLGFD